MNKPTIFKNNQWAVTVDGDLVCETFVQVIDRATLENPQCDKALAHFEWFDRNMFNQARDRALEVILA